MKNTVNYEKYKEQIKEIKEKGQRPSLLFHVCCAVCCCNVIIELSEIFDVTIFYYNDNIYPKEEFDHRLNELKRYLVWFEEKYQRHVELIVPEYDGEGYMTKMGSLVELPEFSERCWNCYTIRLEETARRAEAGHYDYWASVMSVSRYKNAERLNQIGEQCSKLYPGSTYLYNDFKKEQGEQKSNQLAKELDLYRQPYCGCASSLKEYLSRKEKSVNA